LVKYLLFNKGASIVFLQYDYKHCLSAAVTSATAETKSRTQVILKDNGKMYLRHNSFVDDIPLWIALKAMGLESDQEAFQLV
jgi:DNA-directed RNA polymerase III subunit RPC2